MASRRSLGGSGGPSTVRPHRRLSPWPLGLLAGSLLGLWALGLSVLGLSMLGLSMRGSPDGQRGTLGSWALGGWARGSWALEAGGGGAGLDELIFVVSGPNDGEPINGRVISLRLRTNYASAGIVRVHVDGAYAFSRSLQVTAPAEDAGSTETGSTEAGSDAAGASRALPSQEIRLDLGVLERQRSSPVGAKDSTLRVTVYLYDASTLRLRAYDEWTGQLRRPRIELLSCELAASGVQGLGGFVAPEGQVPVIVYPLAEDSYVILFSATDRSALDLSPENPAVYRQTRILVSGNTSRVVGGPTVNRSIVFARPGDTPLHLALWTYDARGGWKRSAIVTVPSRS